MALLNIMYHISIEMDKRKYSIGIFLAFDTIHHNILLNKLEIYGVRGAFYNFSE